MPDNDWTDDQVAAAAGTILHTRMICTAAAQRNGDRVWLEEFSWFVEPCWNELGETIGHDKKEAIQPGSWTALHLN